MNQLGPARVIIDTVIVGEEIQSPFARIVRSSIFSSTAPLVAWRSGRMSRTSVLVSNGGVSPVKSQREAVDRERVEALDAGVGARLVVSLDDGEGAVAGRGQLGESPGSW